MLFAVSIAIEVHQSVMCPQKVRLFRFESFERDIAQHIAPEHETSDIERELIVNPRMVLLEVFPELSLHELSECAIILLLVTRIPVHRKVFAQCEVPLLILGMGATFSCVSGMVTSKVRRFT